jgi:hypothetical protein
MSTPNNGTRSARVLAPAAIVPAAEPGTRPLTSKKSLVGIRRTRTSQSGPTIVVPAAKKEGEEDEGELLLDTAEELNQEGGRNLSVWEAAPWQEKLYAVAEPGSFPSDVPASVELASYIYAFAMVTIIIISSISIFVASMPVYQTEEIPIFWVAVEAVCVAIFTLDIILRFFTIPKWLDFIKDPMNYIDILSVIPFYIQLGVDFEVFGWFRMLRILRLMRIIRVLRTASILGFGAMMDALSKSVSELILFVLISGTCLLILATAFYFVERGSWDANARVWKRKCFRFENCTNGEESSPVQSIPDSFWYTIVTLSTVGYGDVYPKTGLGQFIGTITMIVGIFIIGFPTMILSGHYEAVERIEIKKINTWSNFMASRKKVEPAADILRKRMGWVRPGTGGTASSPVRSAKLSPPKRQARHSETPMPLKPKSRDNLKAASDDDSSFGGASSESDFGQLHGSSRGKLGAPAEATCVGLFMWDRRIRELKRSRESYHRYYYEPLLALQRTMEGVPEMRVIWGRCGQPTMVVLTLILDHGDARQEAARLLSQIDPQGTLECEMMGGFHIRHYTPSGERCKYTLLPSVARDNYRNSDFALYFMRDEDGDGNADDVDYLSEEKAIEEAIAALLGTSLFIQIRLEETTKRRRIPLVQQVLQQSRFQRELELIALGTEDAIERYAYITLTDAKSLLKGISAKLDLKDPGLIIEDDETVDNDIAHAVLNRLRTVKIHQIPAKLKSTVYNGDIIRHDEKLYEVPMSMFMSDELDEVEVDSLGYIEVRVARKLSYSVRIDIRVDPSATINPGALTFSDW